MIGVNLQREVNMSIFGQTKGTELEKQIAQLAQGEAIGDYVLCTSLYCKRKI